MNTYFTSEGNTYFLLKYLEVHDTIYLEIDFKRKRESNETTLAV